MIRTWNGCTLELLILQVLDIETMHGYRIGVPMRAPQELVEVYTSEPERN